MTNKFYGATAKDKKAPFIIILTDPNVEGPYVEELKFEIRKYPKLLMMTPNNFAGVANWSEASYGDSIVFGDANTPIFNFDYRIEQNKSFLAETKLRPVYDLIRNRKEWKRAIRKYVSINNKHIKQLQNRRPTKTLESCMVFELAEEKSNIFKTFSQMFNPYGKETYHNTQKPIVVNIDEELLNDFDEVEITLPKGNLGFRQHCYNIPKKKKNNVEYYIVHQTWVKIGLKAYNIYIDSQDRQFIVADGEKFWVRNKRLYNA